MILTPDNFLFFMFLFTFSIVMGLYTYQTYHRTLLVYINVIMFVLVAIRACAEFWLQLSNDYHIVDHINQYNSILAHTFFTLSWYVLYFYILPFKNFKRERFINLFIGIVVLGIPNIIVLLWFYNFQIWTYSTERIEGYWMFKAQDGIEMGIYNVYVNLFLSLFYTSIIMLYSIVVDPFHRHKKIFLLLFFYIIVFIVTSNYLGERHDEWRVVNNTIPMLLDGIVISWFVSGYRLIRNQFEDASRDIVDSISELIIRIDKNLNVINMNSTAKNLFSSAPKNLKDIWNGESKELEKIRLLNSSDLDKIEIQFTVENISRNFIGKSTPYIWRGQNMGYSLILSDITELKEKERLLFESNQTKDQLFSIIAHDMRKPALAFRGITKKVDYLLKKRDFDGIDKLSDSISQSAQSLNDLLDNLLNWALSQKNLITVRNKSVSINEVFREVMTMLHFSISEKKITIDVNGMDNDLTLYSDPDILITILRNVLDNAVKYSSVQGNIKINAQRIKDSIQISIIDEGIGMTKDQKEKLFDLYQNKSTKGTKGESGSGLGLSLVFDLVQKTCGCIDIESQIGRGTEVNLIYPITNE